MIASTEDIWSLNIRMIINIYNLLHKGGYISQDKLTYRRMDYETAYYN